MLRRIRAGNEPRNDPILDWIGPPGCGHGPVACVRCRSDHQHGRHGEDDDHRCKEGEEQRARLSIAQQFGDVFLRRLVQGSFSIRVRVHTVFDGRPGSAVWEPRATFARRDGRMLSPDVPCLSHGRARSEPLTPPARHAVAGEALHVNRGRCPGCTRDSRWNGDAGPAVGGMPARRCSRRLVGAPAPRLERG